MAALLVYCQPGARQMQLAGLHDGKPKIQLKAPPVDGEANKALISFVASRCGVSKSEVRICSGASSRTKRIEVDGLSDDALRKVFAAPG